MSRRTRDPVKEALLNAEPRKKPLSDDLKTKREQGLADVKARRLHDVYGKRDVLKN